MPSILRIDEAVTLEFFERPGLKYTVDYLFKKMNGDIQNKISQIRSESYMKESEFSEFISYEKIFLRFKYRFFKALLDEAVDMSLRERGKYDVLSNVVSLISTERLQDAIEGKMIIDAVFDVITTIEITHSMQRVDLGRIIALLKKGYLGINHPYVYE